MKSHLKIFFKRKVYFFDNYKTALLYNILLYKDSMMLRYAISAAIQEITLEFEVLPSWNIETSRGNNVCTMGYI